jgi:hypothetical protein
MTPAALIDPMMKGVMLTTVASTVSGGVTTIATNGAQVQNGENQMDLKLADMAAQIPGHVTPPAIHP